MLRIQMDRQGRVTIPTSVRRQLGLGEKTGMLLELGPAGLVLRPQPMASMANQNWSNDPVQPMVQDWQEQGLDVETVVSGETHRPAERRRILASLASTAA